MARNGSGTYNLPAGNPVVTGTVISSTWANTTLTDIGTALTNSIAKDGQTTPTANLPMGGYKLTGLGAATASGDAVRYEQVGTLVASEGMLQGYLFGCTMSTAGSSATMSISAGRATDSTGLQSMALTAIAKTTSAWAVGTATGGLDTGSIANSTWYHFYVIRRPDTGVVDVVFSTNATTPTLPTNYTQYRRIGSGRTNGSAQWVRFSQNGDRFTWYESVYDVGASSSGSGTVARTLTVPLGLAVDAFGSAVLINGADAQSVKFWGPALSPGTVSSANCNFTQLAGGVASGPFRTGTNTSSQINTAMAVSSNEVLRIFTEGWFDTRGRVA